MLANFFVKPLVSQPKHDLTPLESTRVMIGKEYEEHLLMKLVTLSRPAAVT